jgi:hypothetical protein
MVKSKRTKGQTTIYKALYIKLNTNYDQQNTIQNTKDLTILTSTKTLGVYSDKVQWWGFPSPYVVPPQTPYCSWKVRLTWLPVYDI